MKTKFNCPHKEGELVVVDSNTRQEIFVTKTVGDQKNTDTLRKATNTEKRMWYDNNDKELVIVESCDYSDAMVFGN